MNVLAGAAAARAGVINDDEDEDTDEDNEEEDDDEEEEDEDDDDDEDAYEIPDIEIVQEDEEPDDPGELISYDWLPTEHDKYRWKGWLNGSMFRQLASGYKHANDTVECCPNMIDIERKLNKSDIKTRMAYRLMGDTDENYAICEKELISYKNEMTDTIKIIVSNFILDIAKKLDFGTDDNGNELRSWDDFLLAVERTTSKLQCKKILIAAYLIFDCMPNYQKKVSRYVKKIHNIVFLQKSGVRTTKATVDFVHKMVSAEVNLLRKKINKAASKNVGFKYTIMRYGETLDKKKHHNDNRKKLHFYNWMIMYNPAWINKVMVKRRYKRRNPGQTGRRNNYPEDYEDNDSDDSNLKRKAKPSPKIINKKKQKVDKQPMLEKQKQNNPISEVVVEDDSLLDGLSQNSIHTIDVIDSSPEKVTRVKQLPQDNVKKFGMTNNKNLDREEDEYGMVWERERDWGATYFRRNLIKLNKDKEGDIIIEICNYRKPYNREGQFLSLWDDGRRYWFAASSTFHDAKFLVIDYMVEKKITTTICAFGINFKNPTSGYEDPKEGAKLLLKYKKLEKTRTASVARKSKLKPPPSRLESKRTDASVARKSKLKPQPKKSIAALKKNNKNRRNKDNSIIEKLPNEDAEHEKSPNADIEKSPNAIIEKSPNEEVDDEKTPIEKSPNSKLIQIDPNQPPTPNELEFEDESNPPDSGTEAEDHTPKSLFHSTDVQIENSPIPVEIVPNQLLGKTKKVTKSKKKDQRNKKKSPPVTETVPNKAQNQPNQLLDVLLKEKSPNQPPTPNEDQNEKELPNQGNVFDLVKLQPNQEDSNKNSPNKIEIAPDQATGKTNKVKKKKNKKKPPPVPIIVPNETRNANVKQPNLELLKEKAPDQELFDIPIPRKKKPNHSSENTIIHNEIQQNDERVKEKQPNQMTEKLPKEIQNPPDEGVKEKQPNQELTEKLPNNSQNPPDETDQAIHSDTKTPDEEVMVKKIVLKFVQKVKNHPNENEIHSDKKQPNEEEVKQKIPNELQKQSNQTIIRNDNSSSSSSGSGSGSGSGDHLLSGVIEASSGSSGSSSSRSSRNNRSSSTDSESDPTEIASNLSSARSSYNNEKLPNEGIIKEKSQIAPNQVSDKSTHANEKKPNEGDQQQVNTAKSTLQMVEIPILPNQSTVETIMSTENEGKTEKLPNQSTVETIMSKEKQPNDEGKTEKLSNQNTPNPKTKPIKSVKLKFCKKYDHNSTISFEKMEDDRYCKPGKRFDKAFCQGCKDKRRLFVLEVVNDEDIRPSPKTPIYCCRNWKEHCKYALCINCYNDKYEKQRGSRRK